MTKDNHTGRMMVPDLEQLPDMARVSITWVGGNGPHEYILKWFRNSLWAFMSHDLKTPIDLVFSKGDEYCLHEVVLADAGKVEGSAAARDVLAERQRQIKVEGWDHYHDDANERSELAQAAACYALSGTPADEAVFIHGQWNDPRDLFWPYSWDRKWWKPTNRRRDLVKAGALILAEIERLDRLSAPSQEVA